MAEKFDQQWRELRPYFSIEKDPRKLSQLRAEIEKRKRAQAFRELTRI